MREKWLYVDSESLRWHMLVRGMTVPALARESACAEATIQRWLKRSGSVHASNAWRLMEALDRVPIRLRQPELLAGPWPGPVVVERVGDGVVSSSVGDVGIP